MLCVDFQNNLKLTQTYQGERLLLAHDQGGTGAVGEEGRVGRRVRAVGLQGFSNIQTSKHSKHSNIQIKTKIQIFKYSRVGTNASDNIKIVKPLQDT